MKIVWTGALWTKNLDVTCGYLSWELNEFATGPSIMLPQVGAPITPYFRRSEAGPWTSASAAWGARLSTGARLPG